MLPRDITDARSFKTNEIYAGNLYLGYFAHYPLVQVPFGTKIQHDITDNFYVIIDNIKYPIFVTPNEIYIQEKAIMEMFSPSKADVEKLLLLANRFVGYTQKQHVIVFDMKKLQLHTPMFNIDRCHFIIDDNGAPRYVKDKKSITRLYSPESAKYKAKIREAVAQIFINAFREENFDKILSQTKASIFLAAVSQLTQLTEQKPLLADFPVPDVVDLTQETPSDTASIATPESVSEQLNQVDVVGSMPKDSVDTTLIPSPRLDAWIEKDIEDRKNKKKMPYFNHAPQVVDSLANKRPKLSEQETPVEFFEPLMDPFDFLKESTWDPRLFSNDKLRDSLPVSPLPDIDECDFPASWKL